MIRLTYANRTEALLDAFVERVMNERRSTSSLVPVHVIVPGRHVERFLEVRCAEAVGVAANFRFHRLEGFIGRWLARAHGSRPLGRRDYEQATLAALLDEDTLRADDLEPLRAYLEDAQGESAREASRAQLAMRMAVLLEGYSLTRPELLAHWSASGPPQLGLPPHATEDQKGDARWQRALYRNVIERTGRRPLAVHLRALERTTEGGLPECVHVFGLSYVARVYSWLFAALGDRTEVQLYTLNPCMEFWEDVPSEGELRHRLSLPRRLQSRGEYAERSGVMNAPVGADEEHPLLQRSGDPPALTYWGRPGREHVLLLNELTGADFEPRFVDPGSDTVLSRIQRDVLQRTLPQERVGADTSIRAVGCPSVRRELEECAEAIWRAVRADPSLRFNEIAVLVPLADREIYLPHLTSVFREAQQLPHHVVDLPLATESRLVEAAALLVGLPLTSMRRPDLLEVLLHPATRGGADRERWAELVDQLGIFHGLDVSDHEGTYVEEDLLSWDQGVRRLTLGEFMGDDAPIEIGGETYFPVTSSKDDDGVELAALIRSYCADVRFAREARHSLAEWSAFFASLFRGYLAPSDAREESELRRCLHAAESIADGAIEEQVSYRLAAELLRAALGRLGGARGEYLADGVVVSALAPMRAIPFRHIFVLGLGEGRFPTTERRDPLDLRTARRMPGDVGPAERDKYIFLEALLCARDAFCVSWVSRDALTGDEIAASSVATQLVETVQRDYLTAESASRILSQAPLRRHEQAHADNAIRESLAEAEAAAALPTPGDPRESDELRRLLALAALPRNAPETVREVSLASLRYFLESPAQGWARAVLRLDRQREEARVGQTDEPLRAEALERAQTLRLAFETALRERCSPMAVYNREVKRLASIGRWPVGVLAERARENDQACLDAWRRAYMNAVSTHSLPTRVRFGAGHESGESSEQRDPIEVVAHVQGEPVSVRLVGRTEALVESGHASLLLVTREAPPGAQMHAARLRYALRAYFDALALSASGQSAEHRALVLFGGTAAREASMRFAALTTEEAQSILGQLVTALLARAHDYYLPSDAVFRLARTWRTATPAALATAVEAVRRNTSKTYGPLRHELDLPALEATEAFTLAADRFNPFFDQLGLGRAGP